MQLTYLKVIKLHILHLKILPVLETAQFVSMLRSGGQC